jgi:hypothetical protein
MDRKEYNRIKSRRYREKNPERVRETSRKSWWKNRDRGLAEGKVRYQNNKEKRLEQNREWVRNNKERRSVAQRIAARKRNQFLREVVISHYGNGLVKCVLCDEKRFPALTIDHINGGGTKERKSTKRIGSTFYKWLIDNGFPNGYRTLCMSCQFVERDRMYQDPLRSNQVKLWNLKQQ